MTFIPPQEILQRYARLAVECGLRDGDGIQPGETVMVVGQEDAKPLYYEVCCEIWRRGGNVVHSFRPENDGGHNFSAAFYELASDTQLEHFAESYNRGLIAQIDHIVFILGDRHPMATQDVDPGQIAKQAPANMKSHEIRAAKEQAGKLHWTIIVWGTEAMAAEAGLSIEAYWDQIISACSLDDPDPVARWHETLASIQTARDWLNSLDIDRLHVEAEDTDLWLTLGEKRRWIGGTGRNLPSFEVFTTPDWRGTDGHIAFSEPLYYYGKLLRGVRLEFKDGEVVHADADVGGDQIRAMVGQPGGNRVGEFSLTDGRVSKITKFMAQTLYDENVGGPYGNSHLALGFAIVDAYDGDEAGVSEQEWDRLGFNVAAAIHADIITTTDRTVTATLHDGSTRVVYANGRFQNDES
jgi:aminopeptidase